MYSTGSIGLWSVIEEGIGITAGSMPALGPLLHTRVFGRSRSDRSDQPVKPTASMWRRNMAQRKRTAEDSIALDTYVAGNMTMHGDRDDGHVVVGGGGGGGKRSPPSSGGTTGMASGRTSDDGDSQKHILKETKVTITRDLRPRVGEAEEYRKEQILGWRSHQHQ